MNIIDIKVVARAVVGTDDKIVRNNKLVCSYESSWVPRKDERMVINENIYTVIEIFWYPPSEFNCDRVQCVVVEERGLTEP